MVKFCFRRRTVLIGVVVVVVLFLISHLHLKGNPSSLHHSRGEEDLDSHSGRRPFRDKHLVHPVNQQLQQQQEEEQQRQNQELLQQQQQQQQLQEQQHEPHQHQMQHHHHHQPLRRPNGTSSILRVAREIHHEGLPVLMTMVNDAYLPFTFSWLCNTHYMGIHQQTIIITTDLTSRRRLHHYWPGVHVVGLSMGANYSGNQRYQHAGYIRLVVRRAEVALALLEEGMELLLFEVDCVWLASPLPLLQESAQDSDMVVTAISNRPGLVAGGFLYIRPTVASKRLWHRLVELLKALEESFMQQPSGDRLKEEVNDQVFLTRLMRKGYAGIQYKQLPFDQFADGKWYKMPTEGRAMSRPLIINNNWVVGNNAKKKRAKRFGHWFLKDSLHCDWEQVNKTVYH